MVATCLLAKIDTCRLAEGFPSVPLRWKRRPPVAGFGRFDRWRADVDEIFPERVRVEGKPETEEGDIGRNRHIHTERKERERETQSHTYK